MTNPLSEQPTILQTREIATPIVTRSEEFTEHNTLVGLEPIHAYIAGRLQNDSEQVPDQAAQWKQFFTLCDLTRRCGQLHVQASLDVIRDACNAVISKEIVIAMRAVMTDYDGEVASCHDTIRLSLNF